VARQTVAEIVANRRVAGDQDGAVRIAEIERVGQRQQRLTEHDVGQRRQLCAGLACVRQIAGLRHASAIDQHRDHANTASKRGRNFDGNEIVRSMKPAVTLLVSGIQPVGTDNGYGEIAR